MEKRLDKVHISYKHDAAYEYALKAIKTGLDKNNIPYSIDEYDIMYRSNIDDYEKEIGLSDRVVMFVVPNYFKSLDCMFEMTQIFKKGNIEERIFPVVDLEVISRDSNGLMTIKKYWIDEKNKKLEQFSVNAVKSSFLRAEIDKIEELLYELDDFWTFICRNSTGDFKKLIENDAALLIEEIQKSLQKEGVNIDEKLTPSNNIDPIIFRKVNQSGEKSIYIENNLGNITIN